MNIDLTQIILAIIALISAVLTSFVIPWIKSKIQMNNDTLSENQRVLLSLAIETGVRAAEQIYKSDEGQKKKAYVLALLEAQGFKVDTVSVDAAVEAAVLKLHAELNSKQGDAQ